LAIRFARYFFSRAIDALDYLTRSISFRLNEYLFDRMIRHIPEGFTDHADVITSDERWVEIGRCRGTAEEVIEQLTRQLADLDALLRQYPADLQPMPIPHNPHVTTDSDGYPICVHCGGAVATYVPGTLPLPCECNWGEYE